MYSTATDIFHWTDIPVSVLYILTLVLISLFIKRKHTETKPEYRYLTKALLIKIFGAIGFALIYMFYYGGGDTMYYFQGAKVLSNIFINNPQEYFKLIDSSIDFSPELSYIRDQITYTKSPEEWFMVKLLSPISFLSLNRFLTASILTSVFSFYGSWKLYQSFILFFPKRLKEGFWSVFFIPCVIFWGSGILKDTITLCFLGIFLYASIKFFFKHSFKTKYIVAIILSLLIFKNVKVYILIAFSPSLLLGWITYNRQQINSKFLKSLITPIILIISTTAIILFINKIMSGSSKYQIKNIESRAEGFHQWHTALGGSSYSLGEVEYTPIGIIKKIPASLNFTYFRPYLTDIRNITTAMEAIESLVLLYLFILMIYRKRLSWIKDCIKNPLLVIALSFVLVFGFIVGFTSYNYGALARYKIPSMPFFVFILLHFNALHKENKPKKEINPEKNAMHSN